MKGKKERLKLQEINLKGGFGEAVTVNWNSRQKCACGGEIFMAAFQEKLSAIELTGNATWDFHKCNRDGGNFVIDDDGSIGNPTKG